MIEQFFRKSIQIISIDPLLNRRWFQKINPTTVTIFGFIFGLCAFWSVIVNQSILALCFLLLSGYCDMLDGSLARKTKRVSKIGAMLDLFFDRVVEFLIILGFYFVDPTRGLACLVMLGSVYLCVTSFFVVGMFSQNDTEKSFYYNPGLIERAEAFIFFGLMIVFPKSFTLLSALFSSLVLLTALIRLFEFIKLTLRINSNS
ncbi:MAG: Inner membrane protein YnjF [Chlamydiae bacterium]|nr:Inner membrane protein YnjF [Chlamydiota bacterium]